MTEIGGHDDTTTRCRPLFYAHLYAWAVPKAREMGYALALHGSMMRDLDLLAVPWIDNPAPAHDLVKAIAEIMEGEIKDGLAGTVKPHGRRSWVITWMAGSYLDLSVMPTQEPKEGDG